MVGRRAILNAVIGVAALAATPALAGSLFDYGHMPDAIVTVEGRTIKLTVHAVRDTIMLQPTMAEAWSISDPVLHWPMSAWQTAADQFVAPVGCKVTDIDGLGAAGIWEARFTCPPGVDLHQLIANQRALLQRGQPLHP